MAARLGPRAIFAVYLAAVAAVATEGFRSLVHPACPAEVTSSVFERIQDITFLLHGTSLPPGVCIFNPSVMRLRGDLFLWAARAYTVRMSRHGCVDDPTVALPSITNDGWAGRNSLVLAATRTVWNPNGQLNHTLVGFAQLDVPMEDGRLFRDGDGAAWLLMHVPRGGHMSVSLVETSCVTQSSGEMKCRLGLGGTRLLWFTQSRKVEKNWVPHSGTSRMSYPHYPAFGPHSVLDWGSYHEPRVKQDFDAVASNQTFFADLHALYPGMISFAGSTPAVLHDDGLSYVAVGHVRANAQCFHDPANATAGVEATCAAFAARLDQPGPRFFQYQHADGVSYSHHYKEYAFFFYRFSAAPPYEITHISHGYLPCTYHHSGVTFPAGLDRIGPRGDFLISFGEANRYSRLLTISSANLDRLLVPEAQMRRTAASYYLCSVPCA